MDRKLLRNLDYGLIVAVLMLIAISMAIIYSATSAELIRNNQNPFALVIKQFLGVILGGIGAAAAIYIDYRVLGKFYKVIYLGNLALLTLVLFVGVTINDTTGWFRIGPLGFQFQPAELAKIAVIITLAKHLEKKESMHRLQDLISPLLHVALPMLLILRQPDFGTAMVFTAILLGMLYVAGSPLRYVGGLIAAGLGSIVTAVWLSRAGVLPIFKEYQIQRFLVFLDPYSDPTGSGYNVIQSMIAIGSGRFFGNGLFGGTQTQLRFLPAKHTDFIFAVLGEAFGFVGTFLVLCLYGFVIWRGLAIVAAAKDEFGSLMAAGFVSMLFFHLLINIGMTVGVMPVTGIPLPFMSYGASAMVSNLIGIGILLNIYMRRQKIRF